MVRRVGVVVFILSFSPPAAVNDDRPEDGCSRVKTVALFVRVDHCTAGVGGGGPSILLTGLVLTFGRARVHLGRL